MLSEIVIEPFLAVVQADTTRNAPKNNGGAEI
jgi:hypothetical protein